MQQPVQDSGGDAGARGYLLKDSLPGEVFNATRAVHKGDSLFQSRVASRLLDRFYTNTEAFRRYVTEEILALHTTDD